MFLLDFVKGRFCCNGREEWNEGILCLDLALQLLAGLIFFVYFLDIYSLRQSELLEYLTVYVFLWKCIFLSAQMLKINKSCVNVFGFELQYSGRSCILDYNLI